MTAPRAADPHDPFAPFRSRDYRLFSVFVLATGLIERSQGVAIGWDRAPPLLREEGKT